MAIDPLELKEANETAQSNDRLNSLIAISIAILAAFMGICGIKDGNIVQNMQQAQAKSIDTWNYYQAKNIRQDIYQATADQLSVEAHGFGALEGSDVSKTARAYRQLAEKEKTEKGEIKGQALQSDKDYDAYNFHDDQFDLSDAAISTAISLLAVTSLTKKRWLFWIALVPAAFGILMGLAGLFGWGIHPNALIKPLT